MVTDPGTKRRVRRLLLPGLIGLALLVSACTGTGAISGIGETQTAVAPIHQVASIATLRDAFNADAGATRLILLVSPT
jgi:hypothetical protein